MVDGQHAPLGQGRDRDAESLLRANLEGVRARMAAAARRVGRDPGRIRLVAVTKTVPSDIVRVLIRNGVEDLGENRIPQANEKIAAVPEPARWHMIGHVQRNKVKRVVGTFHLLHSVDSLRLAEALSEESDRRGIVTDILLQVNVSGEASKGGFPPDDVRGTIDRAGSLRGLQVRGLMTMAPLVEDPEEVRPVFRRIREIRDDLPGQGPEGGALLLSMGMTQDFEVAIEEGADLIRVGTALFEGLDTAAG